MKKHKHVFNSRHSLKQILLNLKYEIKNKTTTTEENLFKWTLTHLRIYWT